jgi:Streptomycin adenylyltransferase
VGRREEFGLRHAPDEHPSAPVNALSDYDVMLVVEDVRPFFEDRSWLMRNHPPITPPSRGHPARKVCPPRGLTYYIVGVYDK